MYTMPHLRSQRTWKSWWVSSRYQMHNLNLLSHLTGHIGYFILILVTHFTLIRHYMTICTHAAYRMARKVLKSLPYSETILKSRHGADTGSGGVHGKLRTSQHRAVRLRDVKSNYEWQAISGSKVGWRSGTGKIALKLEPRDRGRSPSLSMCLAHTSFGALLW